MALVNLQGRISDCKKVGYLSASLVEPDQVAIHEQGWALVYFNRLFSAQGRV